MYPLQKNLFYEKVLFIINIHIDIKKDYVDLWNNSLIATY